MKVPRRLYYDTTTGHVFFETGNYTDSGLVEIPSVELDIKNYKVLTERNRNTFDFLELPEGAYEQDFMEANGYRINLKTKKLEFSYPDPNNPQAPPVYVKPLTEQIEDLKAENLATMEALAEVYEMMLGGV